LPAQEVQRAARADITAGENDKAGEAGSQIFVMRADHLARRRRRQPAI
jgi:hypothetical protein